MFRTEISLEPVSQPISQGHKCVSIGSCFADLIGTRLADNKFSITNNPMGIIYHPLAQFRVLEMAIKEQTPPDDSFVCSQGIWRNLYFHSAISDESGEKLRQIVEKKLTELKLALKGLDVLFMTFGTAFEFKHKSTGYLVANCHKLPSQEFKKQLTTPNTIFEAFKALYQSWPGEKPFVVFSVSPIRHLREGIVKNSASKSTLRLACDHITESYSETQYFPGYEIMIDDLRDYRFYQHDMIHPNETAQDYIWNMFTSTYLDQESQKFITQWQKIQRNLKHRPFHPHSAGHQEFIKNTLKLIDQLPSSIDTSKEVAALKKDLI